MAEVILKGVSKAFGATQAISEIDMTVPDGAFVVLLGPTGAGKTTLLDAKERISWPIPEGDTGPFGPAHAEAHALLQPVSICGQCRAFVETHHDVRPQEALDFHRPFGAEMVFGPIDMTFERHPIFGQLSQVAEAHDLEAA